MQCPRKGWYQRWMLAQSKLPHLAPTGPHCFNALCRPAFPWSAGGRRRREAERGFTGTALTGLVPAAAGGEGEDGDAKQEGGSEGQRGGIDVDAELAAAAAAGEEMEG